MSERHALASEGAWVELRDPKELKSGDKKKVLRAVSDIQKVMSAGLEITDGLTAMLVVNWQLPTQLPLPSQDITVLDMLEIPDYDRLTELVGPAQKLLFPGSAQPDTPQEQAQAVADPGSPTAPTVVS